MRATPRLLHKRTTAKNNYNKGDKLMKTKKVPMRMCTGCGEMFDKRTLVRVVKGPNGDVSLDLTGKKAGRGAYVCKNADCLKKARKKRAFERAFSMKIEDSVYDKMEEEISNAE